MKRLFKKTQNLIKGTPTAVLLSAAIHAILLLLAGGMVVFSIIEKQDTKFTPQKVKRPTMKLKKLRVKVKETAKPRKTTQRITSRRTQAMPDIQLPAMTGMGSGLEGGVGGFEMLADLSQMTIFGGERSTGNDLEGTFYHLMRDRYGRHIPLPDMGVPGWGLITYQFADAVTEFLKNWSPKTLSKYYQAPRKLYASHFMMPPFASEKASQIYGLSDNLQAALYLVHYKGKIAHPEGGRFRFWATGDDMLFVRINKKLILDGRTTGFWAAEFKTPNNWQSSDPESGIYSLARSRSVIGDWFTLEPGVPVEMEVLMGEDIGGRTWAVLNVQEEGVDYPKNNEGCPVLPAFKTAPIPEHIIDEIEYGVPVDQTDLLGGPIFSAY